MITSELIGLNDALRELNGSYSIVKTEVLQNLNIITIYYKVSVLPSVYSITHELTTRKEVIRALKEDVLKVVDINIEKLKDVRKELVGE